MFWNNVEIIENFRAKKWKSSCCSRNQPESIFKQSVDQTDPLVSLDTDVRRRACLWLTWNRKIHIFTRLPLPDIYLVFMCFAIVLENTLFYIILLLSYIANYLKFLDWREDPRLIHRFVLEFIVFYLIYLCIIFRLLLWFSLLCLSSLLC